jgi:hypothetical protein
MAQLAGRVARLLALILVLPLDAFADPATLTVMADGPLPGFRADAATAFLASWMDAAGQGQWDFAAGTGAPPNRVEWHFTLYPYAGGEVRRFIPLPAQQRIFGPHRLLTARLELYLDGQYQTQVYGQALVAGGPDDAVLGDFVGGLTRQLTAGYRAIDLPKAP